MSSFGRQDFKTHVAALATAPLAVLTSERSLDLQLVRTETWLAMICFAQDWQKVSQTWNHVVQIQSVQVTSCYSRNSWLLNIPWENPRQSFSFTLFFVCRWCCWGSISVAPLWTAWESVSEDTWVQVRFSLCLSLSIYCTVLKVIYR